MKSFNKLVSFICLATMMFSPVSAFAAKEKPIVMNAKLECLSQNWWSYFNDPILDKYILAAIDMNHDLKLATLKAQEYQQLVKIQFGKELPSVGVMGNYFGGDFFGGEVPAILNSQNMGDYAFFVPLFVKYELDLFGKNRDKTKSVKQALQVAQFDEKSAYISIAGIVSSVYLNIVQYDKIIELQEIIVQNREKIYSLIVEQNRHGLASMQDVVVADKSLILAKSALTSYKKDRDIALNYLAYLVGDSAENSQSLVRSKFDDVAFNGVLPSQIASEIILNRPDVKAAESKLQKSSIDVKVARKELLPSFNITGIFGFNAFSSNSLSGNFGMASLLGGVSQSLFTGGQKMANLRLKKVNYEEMLVNYQKTNLQAIQEVNDSLVKIKHDSARNEDNEKKLTLEKQNYNYANESYKAGAISYLDLLQYEELLAAAKKDFVISKNQCYVDYLGLYKSTASKL